MMGLIFWLGLVEIRNSLFVNPEYNRNFVCEMYMFFISFV